MNIQVEAKRIERRVKGTEEVLAADVAEQCAQEDEDSLNYNITESRYVPLFQGTQF